MLLLQSCIRFFAFLATTVLSVPLTNTDYPYAREPISHVSRSTGLTPGTEVWPGPGTTMDVPYKPSGWMPNQEPSPTPISHYEPVAIPPGAPHQGGYSPTRHPGRYPSRGMPHSPSIQSPWNHPNRHSGPSARNPPRTPTYPSSPSQTRKSYPGGGQGSPYAPQSPYSPQTHYVPQSPSAPSRYPGSSPYLPQSPSAPSRYPGSSPYLPQSPSAPSRYPGSSPYLPQSPSAPSRYPGSSPYVPQSPSAPSRYPGSSPYVPQSPYHPKTPYAPQSHYAPQSPSAPSRYPGSSSPSSPSGQFTPQQPHRYPSPRLPVGPQSYPTTSGPQRIGQMTNCPGGIGESGTMIRFQGNRSPCQNGQLRKVALCNALEDCLPIECEASSAVESSTVLDGLRARPQNSRSMGNPGLTDLALQQMNYGKVGPRGRLGHTRACNAANDPRVREMLRKGAANRQPLIQARLREQLGALGTASASKAQNLACECQKVVPGDRARFMDAAGAKNVPYNFKEACDLQGFFNAEVEKAEKRVQRGVSVGEFFSTVLSKVFRAEWPDQVDFCAAKCRSSKRGEELRRCQIGCAETLQSECFSQCYRKECKSGCRRALWWNWRRLFPCTSNCNNICTYE